MKKPVFVLLSLFLGSSISAFEPVTALDDGFAVPSQTGMVEAVLSYPGAESFAEGVFALGAWSVPYGIEDLAVTTCHAGMNCGKAGFSISYSGSGFELYGDEVEKLGVSYALFRNASAGVRITRSAMHISGFGNAAAWSCDAGVILRPFDSVYIAGVVEDITQAELGESSEPLDGRSRFMASWSTTGGVTFISTITKVRRFNPSISAGLTVRALDVLTLGILGANEPDRFEFLCEVTAKGMRFSYRGSYHRDLDLSHGFSLSWAPGYKSVSGVRE